MSAKKNPLRVQPLRRYDVPKYPSWSDPDPTLFPERVALPFSRELIVAVASLGLAGCLNDAAASFVPPKKKATTTAEAKTTEPKAPRSSVAAPESNPFPLEGSGLPFRTSPYGTGEPQRLEAELARRAIDAVFAAEGIELTSGYAYAKDGVAVKLDGYDPKSRLGYVFGDWDKLDGSALISWAESHEARVPDDHEKLSLAEAKKLEARAARGEDLVAVISAFDRRFEYGGWEDEKAEPLDLEGITDEDEIRRRVQAHHEKRARAALEKLERAVREYIAWARAQGQ